MSEGEFNEVLLSIARRGDVDLLEKLISTVPNIECYLNRIYDESEGQKCTILMIACLNDHENIIRILLSHFKLDLEVVNDILLEESDEGPKMYLAVSILWAAAARNKFQIVKLLIENGAEVNFRTMSKSTPLRSVCLHGNIEMARYLIENGADVYAINENKETILMVSANYGHLHMVNYFINEFNFDVNVCDNDGRSALYDAVHCESLEIVEVLLEHGARNFPATIDQMSPLLRAAEQRCTNLIKAISSHCSLIEQIEAEELLGSAYIYAQPDGSDLNQAFQCFHRALTLRTTHNLPKTLRSNFVEIFDDQQECQTIEQLEEIRYNYGHLYIEGLFIRERLLGLVSEKYHHSLYYCGALLADIGQQHKALRLWLHGLNLHHQYSIPIAQEQLRDSIVLTGEMLIEAISIPVDIFVILLELIGQELDRNKIQWIYNLHTLLFSITVIAKVNMLFSKLSSSQVSILALK